jgi:hypothetical protein
VSPSCASSRFVVRVVVFPLQPFFAHNNNKRKKRWIVKFIVHINNSLSIDQFNYLTRSHKSFNNQGNEITFSSWPHGIVDSVLSIRVSSITPCRWCSSSTVPYVHLFVFFFLVTSFNSAWSGHYGFLEDRKACLPSRRGASAHFG